jgi:hypothetical protein
MKIRKLLLFLSVTFLFVSCVQDEPEVVLVGGAPTEVSLLLGLADVDGPDVSLSTSKALDATLKVTYSGPEKASLRAITTLNNVWVLQFDSTGVIGTAGNCVAANFLGTVTVGENLNPTLITGTNQVVYVLANGPASGSITTDTYTLSTFKDSAAFTGSITDDSAIPYLGRIAGGITLTGRGTIQSFTPVTLRRIAAKVSLKLNFNVTGLTVQSVRLYNAPLNMYYLYGSDITSFPVTPSASTINALSVTANVIPTTPSSGMYVWYTGENKRGENSSITSALNKYWANTPSSSPYCSYVRITAMSDDAQTLYYYYLYLGANGTTDFNVKRNWEYMLNASIAGTTDFQAACDASDGRVRKKTGTANCCIVEPGTSYTLPVNIKGNGNTTLASLVGGTTSLTVSSVKVLWQTSAGLVTVTDFNSTKQMATITAGANSGNAVIAAYDADGTTILWSWHVWVTNYDPDVPLNGTTYQYTNYVTSNRFMDRNLGATSVAVADANTLGLLYEWGRKDPFVGSSTYNGTTNLPVVGTAITLTSGSTSIANTILNPTYYYYNTVIPNDWNSSPNYDLWGGASTSAKKTIFDPCPTGWRIPSYYKSTISSDSPWSGLSTYQASTYWSTNGYQWTTTPGIGFWPATGFRHPYTGLLSNVGSNGVYWTGSTYSYYAYVLYINSGSVSLINLITRGQGSSARCVQEW